MTSNRSAAEQAEEAALEAEWVPDADGVPHRKAARVVAFDPAGRILLLLGHDEGDMAHRWYFTPGGGLAAGESARDGAVREFREETGVRVEADRLEGPVLHRHATFHFVHETRRQDEEFFTVRLTAAEAEQAAAQRDATLTLWERELLEGAAWYAPDNLGTDAVTYPRGLDRMAAAWWRGWDGRVAEIWES